MKKFIKILTFVILSFSLQTAVLYYLSNFYFTDDTQISFKEVELKPVISETSIKFETNAQNIKLSPSGKYCSYYFGDKLNIINLEDDTKNYLNLDKSSENYFYKWHESEDKIIISEKINKYGEANIKLYTYNPKTNLKQEALDYNNESKSFKLHASNAVVNNIELNTMNTIMYLKTSTPAGTNFLERLDVSSGINKLPINTTKIGTFFVAKQKDEIVYENIDDHKIYITDKSKNIKLNISSQENLKLLYVDKNDTAYIGELKNNTLNKIIKKSFSDNSEKNTLDSIPLENSVFLDSLHILNSGKIYVVDNAKGTAENIEKNTKVTFKGNFIDMNDSGVLSTFEEKLIFTPLK